VKRQAESSTTPGNNHTGLAPHPKERDDMLQGAREFRPTSSGGPDEIARVRIAYARAGDPHGTLSAASVDAARLPVLDKLGARLQFERTGTRLYDALISKFDAYGGFDGGPGRPQLVEIRGQEHAHALLAQELIRALGGDPTMVTPRASLQATASRGIIDVLVDPRTSLIDGLEAILAAELVDQDSWAALARSAEALGNAGMAAKIVQAQQIELQHLKQLRGWLEAADRVRAKAATEVH
jgi:hypothetical protein